MNGFNPDYLPPNRRKAAAVATRAQRLAMIRDRARIEGVAALSSLQEAARTAGVVLAVLLVVDLYRAPVWVICALFFAPLLSNGAVLLVALLLARRKA